MKLKPSMTAQPLSGSKSMCRCLSLSASRFFSRAFFKALR